MKHCNHCGSGEVSEGLCTACLLLKKQMQHARLAWERRREIYLNPHWPEELSVTFNNGGGPQANLPFELKE